MPGRQNLPDENANPGDALPTQQVPEANFAISDKTDELRFVSFYLPSRSEPVIIADNVITVGRRDPKRRITPTIDLSEERGAQLGVSRIHAEITYQNARYVIKDMGSSNGTWVNNTKLTPYQPHPLTTGDQLRFGQLSVSIHITLPVTAAKSTTDSQLFAALTDSDFSFIISSDQENAIHAQGGFTPSILGNISSLLSAIEQIYTVICQAQQRETDTLTVVKMRTEPLESHIVVAAKNGSNVVDFLANVMPQFINTLDESVDDSATEKVYAAVNVASIQKYTTLPEKISEFALQYLVADALDPDHDDLVQQLVPLIENIQASTLKLNMATPT